MSPLPVHIYVVNPTREVWTHSDTDGTFDVIAIADVAAGNLTATKVPVSCHASHPTTREHPPDFDCLCSLTSLEAQDAGSSFGPLINTAIVHICSNLVIPSKGHGYTAYMAVSRLRYLCLPVDHHGCNPVASSAYVNFWTLV